MTAVDSGSPPHVTADILLQAYACGLFPMAEDAEDDGLFWVEPDRRGIVPLDTFRPSRSLAKLMRRGLYDVRVDTDFEAVVAACAAPAPGRETTWINRRIRSLYGELFERGVCHTVEVWRTGETGEAALVGGLYGLAINGAFFGESMFSREANTSKIALARLVERLNTGGFALLDTQFLTDHLASMGAVEIDRDAYMGRLNEALRLKGDWRRLDRPGPPPA